MKKLIFTILAVSSCILSAYSQIPNNGFENWTQVGTYMDPDGWGNLNSMTSPLGVLTCEKGTPGSPGNSYLKLTSRNVMGFGVIPGIAVSGEIDPATATAVGGFAYNQRPQKLTGKWQYMAFAANDQGYIGAVLTKWNSTLNQADTIAAIYYALPGMVMSWASFALTFNYLSNDTPDSCLIVLASSGAHAANNSYLYIDNLAFSGSVGITEPGKSLSDFRITPNPVHGVVHFSVQNQTNAPFEVSLSDITGRQIVNLESTSGTQQTDLSFDTADLPKGLYLVTLKQSGAILETRKLLVQ